MFFFIYILSKLISIFVFFNLFFFQLLIVFIIIKLSKIESIIENTLNNIIT